MQTTNCLICRHRLLTALLLSNALAVVASTIAGELIPAIVATAIMIGTASIAFFQRPVFEQIERVLFREILEIRVIMGTRKKRDRVAPKGFLVDLLMPPDRAEDALFNILDRYDYWVVRYGMPRARLIFFTQCAGAILTFWTDWLLRRVKLLEFLRRS
jgi:hypothetical protein